MTENLRLRSGPRPPTHERPQNFIPGHPELVLNGNYLPFNFREESKQIAKDVVMYVCKQTEPGRMAPTRPCQIMRSLVQDTINVRKDMFEDFAMRIGVRSLDQVKVLQEVTTEMFSDETVSWGRIVTLFAFCAYLANFLEHDESLPGAAGAVAATLSDITINRLGLWIVANGEWKKFDSQFPAICWLEYGGIWKGLAITVMLVIVIMFFFVVIRYFG